MQTSLLGIANKAKEDKKHRFRNLAMMLSKENLLDSWKYMNRKAAPGVDEVIVSDYETNLLANIANLYERLKTNRYHAKLVKRVHIPKGNGKLRPLGLPVLEDKLVQKVVARILDAIYEQDFLSCSFGYRPKIGPKNALKRLTDELQLGTYSYIVEADIKGYFDSIDHDKLVEFLCERIDDRQFIRLIKKWLKAGILETDGKVFHPETGTPQGGVISSILANVYLHYVLDLWFKEVVKPKLKGKAYICRYADDFVCAFQYKEDAERFFSVLPRRLGRYGLELAKEKTRLMSFSKFRKYENTRFVFLQFQFCWGKDRTGRDRIKVTTCRERFRRSVKELSVWCKENRSLRPRVYFKKLNEKLRGYYIHYGIRGNYKSLGQFNYLMERNVFKWLNRRSQKKSFTWEVFRRKLVYYEVVRPRIKPVKVNRQLSFQL